MADRLGAVVVVTIRFDDIDIDDVVVVIVIVDGRFGDPA